MTYDTLSVVNPAQFLMLSHGFVIHGQMQILEQELPDNLTWVSEFMAAWYPIVYIRKFNEVFRVMQ